MSNGNQKFSDLAALGFSVFPIHKGGKKAALRWSPFQVQHATDEELKFWDGGDYNVGIACGRLSDLLVVDIDSDEAQAVYDSFGAPLTPVVKTAKGRHYYYRYPHVEVRNRVRVGQVPLDVRGEGGYVVAPGSTHESGAAYEWEISPHDQQIATLPQNLLSALTGRSSPVAKTRSGSPAIVEQQQNRFASFVEEIALRSLKNVREAVEGERNDALFKASAILASHVAAARLEWQAYADRLFDAAIVCGLEVDEASATIESAWKAGNAQPAQWIETAQAYAYVSIRDQFYHIDGGHPLSANGFNRTHNSERRWEKGNIATFLTDNDLIEKVTDLRFNPGGQKGVYKQGGQQWLNTYTPPDFCAVSGDATPFVEFVEHLVPNEIERAHLMRMIAWTVRNPAVKLHHALLFRSAHQGVGKSMLVEIWRELLGVKNTRLTTTEEISGPYQSFIDGNLLVVVEELNLAVGMQVYNRIKNLITGHTAEVNEKFVSSRERPNHANFVFLTNLPEPILIEDSDRRFFFIDSPAKPRDADYYSAFVAWWKANPGIIRGYIDSIDLDEFNPHAPPPDTEAKSALRLASKSPLEQELLDAIAERRWPFTRDIVRLEEIKAHIQAAHPASPQRLKSALRGLGAIPLGQQRVSGEWIGRGCGPPTFVGRPNARASLWAIRNVEYWGLADPHEWGEEFARYSGVWEALDGVPIGLRHVRSNADIYSECLSC